MDQLSPKGQLKGGTETHCQGRNCEEVPTELKPEGPIASWPINGKLEYDRVRLRGKSFPAMISNKGLLQNCRHEVELRPVSTALAGAATGVTPSVGMAGTASDMTLDLLASGLLPDTRYHWQARLVIDYCRCAKKDDDGNGWYYSSGDTAHGPWRQGQSFQTGASFWTSLPYALHVRKGFIVSGNRDSLKEDDGHVVRIRTPNNEDEMVVELQAQTRTQPGQFRLIFKGKFSSAPESATLWVQESGLFGPRWSKVLDLSGTSISGTWTTEGLADGYVQDLLQPDGYINVQIRARFPDAGPHELEAGYYLAEAKPQ